MDSQDSDWEESPPDRQGHKRDGRSFGRKLHDQASDCESINSPPNFQGDKHGSTNISKQKKDKGGEYTEWKTMTRDIGLDCEELAENNKKSESLLENMKKKIAVLEKSLKEANKKMNKTEERNSEPEIQLREENGGNRKLKKNMDYFIWIVSVLLVVPLGIGLHLSFKGHEINHHELRLMLVGKTGAGMSASGNTILGEEFFRVEASPASVTASCKKKNKLLDGRNITIIDTPGVMDTWLISNQKAEHAHECISMFSPDPHAFLLVIRLGRFTVEESNAVKWIQENFGADALKFTMILFTGGDLLEGKPVHKFISNSVDLQSLVDTCEGRYHVFNNYEKSNRTQVTELFEKIKSMLHKNMGYIYTKQLQHKVQQNLAKEMQSREKEIRHEEELKRKYMAEEIQLEDWLKMDEIVSKLRDEQYENKILHEELEHAYSTSFWFKVSTGLLILILIGVLSSKNSKRCNRKVKS